MKSQNKTTTLVNKHFLAGVAVATAAIVLTVTGMYMTGQMPQVDYVQAGKNPPASTYTLPSPDPNNWDQTAPTVSIVSPTSGSTISTATKSGALYVVNVQLSASDNDRISRIYVFVDGALDSINAYNATSYQVQTRIPTKTGTHTIKAIAYDFNNNPAQAEVSVVVPR